ncbi:MAG: DivIVA domain-containing protein [Antricoccus sp.]
MGTLLWVVFGLVGVSALIYYAASVIFGPGEEIIAADPDRAPVAVADNRVLVAGDIERVRFPMAVRGYRMDEVDKFLDRIADELAIRDAMSARSTFVRVDAGNEPRPEPDNGIDRLTDNEPSVAEDKNTNVSVGSADDLTAGAAVPAGATRGSESAQPATDDIADWAPNANDIPEAGENRLE